MNGLKFKSRLASDLPDTDYGFIIDALDTIESLGFEVGPPNRMPDYRDEGIPKTVTIIVRKQVKT